MATTNRTGQKLPLTAANLFCKNVCQDPTLFPKLDNDVFNVKWTLNTLLIAKLQLVEYVLNVAILIVLEVAPPLYTVVGSFIDYWSLSDLIILLYQIKLITLEEQINVIS